jgi:hypothetical protein
MQSVTKFIGGQNQALEARKVHRDLLTESKKHKAWERLREIPSIGPIRAAQAYFSS